MTSTFEYIKKMSWCPQRNKIKTPLEYEQEEQEWKCMEPGGSSPGRESSPKPNAVEDEQHGCQDKGHYGYQDNSILLILLALAWLFPVVYQRDFLSIFVVLNAAVMYYDAQNIHAGRKFEKESLLGDIVTWSPTSWGAVTLVGGPLIIAIYLFHRKEIFNANT